MDYFMNEDISDVVFVVEEQRIPAIKVILSLKSNVFRAMFSGKFKEAKDKEVVIEETNFEAFKTLIQFLYCDHLILKDCKDFPLIEEICKLSDRFDTTRIRQKVSDHLMAIKLSSDMTSLKWITKIAFDYKLEELMAKVMTFIEKNVKWFAKRSDEELVALDILTHNEFLKVLAKSHIALSDKLY